jgi:hypothetical protein
VICRLASVLAFVLAGCALDPEPVPDERLRADESYGVPFAPASGRQPFAATGFNAFLMDAAKAFGPGSYLWQGDGVTKTVSYQGTTIAKPYAAGKCMCVGATFQVYMTAFQAWDAQHGTTGSLRGLSVAQVKQLKSIWYVATSALEGSQAALVKLGLGSAVKVLDQAQPGDPVQLWRNNGSGHSVIFDSWVKSGGKITGLTYFSCNSGGPGFITEPVGTGTKEIDVARIHVGHPFPPVEVSDGGAPEARPREAKVASDAATPDAPEDLGTVDQPAFASYLDASLARPREEAGCDCATASTPGLPLLALFALPLLALRRRARSSISAARRGRGPSRCRSRHRLRSRGAGPGRG